MSFPDQDTYWKETAVFIRNTIGLETPFIAPREFRSVLPRVFPYDYVHAIEILSDYGGIAVHKGLLHELPLPVLQFVKAEWKCVFANEVFLFYVPAKSELQIASGTHQTFFRDRLVSLQELAEFEKSQIRELAALVVVASHSPAALDKTLRSMVLLHTPIIAVATGRRQEYEAVCQQHHVRLQGSGNIVSVQDALKAGARYWLDDPDITWICSFDDTMLVRPDFLLVMESLRSKFAHSALGGLWTEADGVRASFSRDGLPCVIPRRENPLHRYAHRDYWQRRVFLTADNHVHRNRASNLSSLPAGTFIVRDLVTLHVSV
jgi:hypothetical protein